MVNRNQSNPLARNYKDPDEEAKMLRQQQLQHAQINNKSGPLGQLGGQVKNKLLGTAASFITKALFGFEDGGSVKTGIPQGGHAAPAIAQYLKGPLNGSAGGGLDYNPDAQPDWRSKYDALKTTSDTATTTRIADEKRAEDKAKELALANTVQASGDSSYTNVAAPAGYEVGTTILPSGEVVPAYVNTTFKSGSDDTRTETQALKDRIDSGVDDDRFGTVGAGGVDILSGTAVGNAIKALTSTPDPYNGAGTDGNQGAQGGGLKSEIGGAYDPRGTSNGSVASNTSASGPLSGGGSDGVGNWGAVGDVLGGIGDALGITDYASQNTSNLVASEKEVADQVIAQAKWDADRKAEADAAAVVQAQAARQAKADQQKRDDRDNERQAERNVKAANENTYGTSSFDVSDYWNDGGQVLPPQIKQLLQAAASGQISRQQVAQQLAKMGVAHDAIPQILSQIPTPRAPLASSKPEQSGREQFVEEVATAARGPLGGPRLPSEFANGGKVMAQGYNEGGSVTAMPTSGPVSKVVQKSKKVQGHNSEESTMELSFDTSTMPPMSDMANNALKKLN